MGDWWKMVFWVCSGVSCLLFILQSVFWTGMRMKKLTVPRWTTLARRLRIVSIGLLSVGALIWLLGGGGQSRYAATWALFGGGFNALIATFHLLRVAYLSGGRAGGLSNTRPSRDRRSNQDQG